MNTKTPIQPQDIEQRLQKTTPVVLSVQEKSELKASLLSYVQYHEKSQAAPVVSHAYFSWYRLSGVFAVFLFFVGTAGAWSHQSLPGESLYQLKLLAIEPALLSIQYPDLDTPSTQIKKMELRLAEVKRLQQEGPLTDAAREDVVENIRVYAQNLVAEESVPTGASLKSYDKAIALVNAQDELFNGDTEQTATSSFDDVTDLLEEEQSEQIEELLASDASETVSRYIEDSVVDIKTKISSQDFDADTVEILGDSINNVANSLSTDSLEEAQEYIADMNQLMLTEEYLDEEAELES